MTVLVIFNPKAGISKNNEREIIENYLKENNYDYEFHLTEIDFGPFEILESLEHKYDLIITCGGDGTISHTIHGMHTYLWNCPLLIVPIGTTNEISQNLGLDKNDLVKTLSLIEEMNYKEVDYGLMNENKTFTYALTFGNFTEVTYNTPQKIKNWLGYRAYILYGFLSFRRIKTYRVQIKSDNARVSGNYVFGAISNSTSMGNIIHFDEKEVSLSDGLFEVLLISKPNSVKELRLILSGMMQNNYENEMFTVFKSKTLNIMSKEKIDWNIDGEFGGTYDEIVVENLQKSIKLIV